MTKTETFKLKSIILENLKSDLHQYKTCRVYNNQPTQGQRDMDFYIEPAQAIILSDLAIRKRKLSLAENIMMASCSDRLCSLKKNDVAKVTEEARNALYKFVK